MGLFHPLQQWHTVFPVAPSASEYPPRDNLGGQQDLRFSKPGLAKAAVGVHHTASWLLTQPVVWLLYPATAPRLFVCKLDNHLPQLGGCVFLIGHPVY